MPSLIEENLIGFKIARFDIMRLEDSARIHKRI
jgi:hypothetical protein